MITLKTLSAVAISVAAIAAASPLGARAMPTGPTCSDTLDIEVHGQHVIGDYVTGVGHDQLDWPARDREIGETVGQNRGVVVRGGPGPGFHFDLEVAPGASFCTDSRSPGAHL
jgi:hypothetical protein